MLPATFDDLLIDADATARGAQWPQTFETLSRASLLQPQHAGVVTGLGTCLLQLGQPERALPYFIQAVELEPASPEAHNNLGVAYLAIGEPERAEAACRGALARDAEHLPAWRNLALACLRQGRPQDGVLILGAIVRAHPDDLESLLLLGRCYAEAGQHQSARYLYQRAIEIQPQEPEALAALAALPPVGVKPTATVDVSRLARPEHASKLTGLRKKPTPTAPKVSAVPDTGAPRPLAVAFYGSDEVLLGARLGVAAMGLRRRGHRVSPLLPGASTIVEGCGLYVFSSAQLSDEALNLMTRCRQTGARIVVDLDDDFHHMPPDHPGYKTLGPGNPANLRRLERAIAEADLLIASTPVLAQRYGACARRTIVQPGGWNDANPLWDRPAPRRSTLNIGWAGTTSHRSDFDFIWPALARLVRDVPNTQLVIGGDPALYESLTAVPETRRLFLPASSYEDYPYLLSHFDVLLAPLRDNPFNEAKAD